MIVVFALILYLGHAFVSIFVVLLQVMVFKEVVSLRYIVAKERKLYGFRTLHW
jgi:phosphatidate cytidylyltransferase